MHATLNNAVSKIIDIVERKNVAIIFYKGKNFIYPELRSSDFETDVEHLSPWFPGKSCRIWPAE